MPAPEADPAPAPPLRFGPQGRFELRPADHRLLVDGAPAALGGRALDMLLVLASQPQRLFSKAELLARVWAGLVVAEGNLRVQVNTLRRLLGDGVIDTVPGHGYRFAAEPWPQAAAPPPPAAAPTQAPAAGPILFGRDADLAALRRALDTAPGCVSLVGTPGVGKSSLARAAVAGWAGPSAWVDLAPLTEGAQLPAALARALGGQLGTPPGEAAEPGDAMPQLLRLLPPGGTLLLVLDNAEHLVAACAGWVDALLAAAPARLLVTSQLPLGVQHEQVLRLEPLPVVDGQHGPDITQGALALLVARIQANDARYPVTPAALPPLAELCRQLDGLPLALEMAAARVPLLGLQAVQDALAERFALLARGRRDAPSRHRTLLAALDWSYALLEPDEQQLFRALSVFAGGFTLELALALTRDDADDRWALVDRLAALVERSLVSVDAEEPPRYRLLQSLREYALQKCTPDERLAWRRRHGAALLAHLGHRTDGADSAVWLPEMDNVREAFLWAREHELALAAELAARAARPLAFTVWRPDVAAWVLSLRPAMEQAPETSVTAPVRALWWSMLAYHHAMRQDPAAVAPARHAVTLWRALDNRFELRVAAMTWVRACRQSGPELDEACAALEEAAAGDESPRARAHLNGALAAAARLRGDIRAELEHTERELLALRELGLVRAAQASENNVCVALWHLGLPAQAVARAQPLLARIDADGGDSNGNLPWVLNVLIESLVALGRLDEAAELAPRALAAGRRFATPTVWLGVLPLVAAQQRVRSAARLAGYVRRRWTADGSTLHRVELASLALADAAIEARLEAPAIALLQAEGRALDDDAADELALSGVD